MERRGDPEVEWEALYKFENKGEVGQPFSILLEECRGPRYFDYYYFNLLLLQGEANVGCESIQATRCMHPWI